MKGVQKPGWKGLKKIVQIRGDLFFRGGINPQPPILSDLTNILYWNKHSLNILNDNELVSLWYAVNYNRNECTSTVDSTNW